MSLNASNELKFSHIFGMGITNTNKIATNLELFLRDFGNVEI